MTVSLNDAVIGEHGRAVSHVLFDFDGTLANTLPAISSSYRYAFAKVLGVDFPATEEDWLTLRKMRLFELAEHLGGDRAAECIAAFRECYHGEPPEPVVLYEGVPALLDALDERGVGYAIVTNKTRPGLDADLARTGLDSDRFLASVTAEQCPRGKPDPGPLLLGLELLSSSADHAVYVGDGPHDMVAAKAAAMRGFGAAYGDWGEDALREAGATAIARDPLALLALLEQG